MATDTEQNDRDKLVDALEDVDEIAAGDGPFNSPRWMMHRANLSPGERIKTLRAAMDISERELGERIGMRWAVQKWEGGKSEPNLESLKRLVWFFRERWTDFDLQDLTGPLGPDRWEQ